MQFLNSHRGDKFRRFIYNAKNCRIPIHPENRKIGIVCTLIGWVSIAYIETVFPAPKQEFPFFFNFFLQFFVGTFFLLVASLFFGKGFLKIKESTELKIEDQSQHITHLSVAERKSLIFWRGLIAIAGYVLYSWAKSNTQIIDNSAVFSTDAIMYALIMYFLLKIKIGRLQWTALSVSFLGVCFITSVDIFGAAPVFHNILSLFGALSGAAALAIIVLLNTVIIQHEPPLRVAFFQCLIGLVCAAIFVGFWIVFNPTELRLIDMNQVTHSVVSGTIYSIALIFFFNAFLYTEPFLIVMMGYSIFPFGIFFSWVAGRGVPSTDIIGLVLIVSGGLASIFLQREQDKKNTYANISGRPIYLSTLKESFRALKQDFLNGRLGRFEYLSQRHEFNKLIFEYAEDIKNTDIEGIKIDQDGVVFTLKKFGVKMFSDKGCRSAPLEILNFGSYEENESYLVFQMIEDQDVILDIGANVGWYSIQLAKRFKNATIHSFEPIPPTFSVLEKNVKLNDVKNVVLHKLALGEVEEQSDFFYFQSGSAVASRINLLNHDKAIKVRCEINALDTIISQLDIPKIDFIKCDIEGAELSFLKGAVQSISRFLPIIYIELFHGWCEKFDYTPNDVIEFLRKYGYQCFRIFGHSIIQIDDIDKEFDDYNFFFLNDIKHETIINKFKKTYV